MFSVGAPHPEVISGNPGVPTQGDEIVELGGRMHEK